MNQNRRNFLLKSAMAGTAAALIPSIIKAGTTASLPTKALLTPEKPAGPEPTEAQKKWMSLKFGMFLHFGINTFYDLEWSDGTLDPAKYDPKELDTDQWCSVAKAAGMKYVVIVTKHHDGFCNFPSKYTKYSVESTPFGKDLVKMVVDSARKHGLEVGLYYSLWDRHEPSYPDDNAYTEFMKNQLTELLTNYGPICELWFDGMWKKQHSGWKEADNKTKANPKTFMDAWRNEGAFRWQMDHIYQFVKKIQPDMMVMNNATTEYPGIPLFPADIRSGEKATKTREKDQKIWNWKGDDMYLPLQIETTMSQKGKDQFSSGSWFWHEWDHSVATKEQIKGWLAKAAELNANLLLNCGPMANGKLRPEDEKVLRSLNG
jgi:alpha-L-fucosidase